MPLEIVPEKDPTMLRAGDEFPVRVLRNGAPLADFSLGIVREGKTNRAFRKTDLAAVLFLKWREPANGCCVEPSCARRTSLALIGRAISRPCRSRCSDDTLIAVARLSAMNV